MSNEQGIPLILALDAPSATLEQVGGKGASLARMAAAGLPVPSGFHITIRAYQCFVAENRLQEQILAAVSTASADKPETLEEAARQIASLFEQGAIPDEVTEAIRQAYAKLSSNQPVAVRSSATAEDLPEMSFAGQQETYLNMRGEVMVLDAVKRCWASLWTARAIGYRARYNILSEEVSLAVVVQELVPADAAGILFTANPMTGARDQIMINAAWGLGEAIVGGQVTPDTIVFDKASGRIIEHQINEKNVMTVSTPEGTREEPVPAEQRTQAVLSPEQAAQLARISIQIEDIYGKPMDIEWARQNERFFIVQARPITTLREQQPVTEVWNDSLAGNYLWTSGNVGEAVPDVMTPSTWSLIEIFISKAMATLYMIGKDAHPIGNIGGRFYLNLSLSATVAGMFGMGGKRFSEAVEEVFGRIPYDMKIPLIPLSRWKLLRAFFPLLISLQRRIRANQKKMPEFLAHAPARCDALRTHIRAASHPADLTDLWQTDVEPYFHLCCYMLEAGARRGSNALVMVRRELRKLVSEAETNALVSGLSSGSKHLESLGPLISLSQLARGEIDRATFGRQYGHRGPHEFEVSLPRPAEDPNWVNQQLAGLRDAPVDVTTLLTRQKEVQKAAWKRFQQRYPRKVTAIRRRVAHLTDAAHDREGARSEVVRVFWVLRTFVQCAGELTGLGEDIFFLSIEEILALLGGDKTPLATIPTRRATYKRYSTLPPYPMLIRGHFDPIKWAANPNRRSDVFDASGGLAPVSDTITGFAGAIGIVEGRARVIATPEEGDQLQVGEILVTTITNVGWTPLFPRAAAVVTDIGAPLSHAAIVARELGIPAVVGCGNATMRLHTGDQIRVNGEQGTVEVLKAAVPV